MKKWIGIAALVSVMGASSALAGIVTEPDPVGGLVMKIDTVNDEFYFEGSDAGNAKDDGIYQLSFFTQNDYAFSQPSLYFILGDIFTGFDMGAGLAMEDFGGVELRFLNFDDITSLTPTAEKVSYAGLPTAADRTLFESMIGDSFSVSTGSGYSNISIQAVPEPATMGLMVVAGGVVYLRRRSKLRDFS